MSSLRSAAFRRGEHRRNVRFFREDDSHVPDVEDGVVPWSHFKDSRAVTDTQECGVGRTRDQLAGCETGDHP